jgi:hypothetical protein
MDELQHEYFLFLNRLRESGVTNMFGAGRYLAKHYDLSHRVAGKILIAWMRWVQSNPKNRDL